MNLATAPKFYIGSSEVAKVFFGTTEIWSNFVPWDGIIPLTVPPIPLVSVATGIKAAQLISVAIPLAVPPIPEVAVVVVGPPSMEAEWMAWDYDPFDPMLDEDMLVTNVFT